jgi:hypothetical protein
MVPFLWHLYFYYIRSIALVLISSLEDCVSSYFFRGILKEYAQDRASRKVFKKRLTEIPTKAQDSGIKTS